jgi:hypothetical protein
MRPRVATTSDRTIDKANRPITRMAASRNSLTPADRLDRAARALARLRRLAARCLAVVRFLDMAH